MAYEHRSKGPWAVLQPDGSLVLEVPLNGGKHYRRVTVDRGGKSSGRAKIRKDYSTGRKPSGRR